MTSASIIDILRAAVPGAVLEDGPAADMPVLIVDAAHLVEVSRALRDRPELQFSFLADVTCVDRLPQEPRFELVYHLACLGDAFAQPGGAAPARRLRMKIRVGAHHPHAPSVTGVWPTAGWPEREVFDLFGVIFDGHADLRRILMTDEWEGHPLRKDYPVQIRKTTSAWSAMQMTPEEFAKNIQAARDVAKREDERG